MLLSRLRQLYWSSPARRWALILLAVLFAVCLANLSYSPRPWKDGVAPRVAQGKNPTPKHFVATYNWYMAAANAGLLAALMATIPIWVRPREARPAMGTQLFTRPDALAWATLAVATGAWLFFTAPRLDHSLWGDEEFTFRRVIHGDYERANAKDPASPLEFQRMAWWETVYWYRKPNNHNFQSILSRASHEIWLATLHVQCEPEVGETALRLPSFLAGLATLGGVVGLGAVLGSPRAGAGAALLLALHPWFQRYTSEARGYALMLLFSVLAVTFLLLALRSGRWRWWLGYGLAQFLLLWSFVGAMFVPLVLNTFAAGWLAWQWWRVRPARPWALSNFARLVVMNLLSAMFFLQFMAPCLPMLREYLANEQSVPEKMDATWFWDVGGYVLGGMDGRANWGDVPVYQSWEGLLKSQPALFWLALLGCTVPVVAGLGVLLRQRRAETWLVAAWILLPISIAIIQGQITQNYFYVWYLIYVVPGYALAWGLGLERLAALVPRARSAGLAALLVLVVAMVLPALFPRLWSQRQHSVEPLQESVEITRPASWERCYPYQESPVITCAFMMYTPAYDPATIRLDTAEELRALAQYAREAGKPLYVNFGGWGLAQARLPDLMQEVVDSGNYQRVAEVPATWPLLTRHIFELKDISPPGGQPAVPSGPESAPPAD